MDQKHLSESQHLLWDRIMDERNVQVGREKRALEVMLRELGGQSGEGWQWDENTRTFWRELPDEPGRTTQAGG